MINYFCSGRLGYMKMFRIILIITVTLFFSFQPGTTSAATKNVSLTATPETGPAPLTVRLDASRSGIPNSGITRASWDPGDGGTISGPPLPSTTYIYTIPGTYTATYSFMAEGDQWICSTVITVEESIPTVPPVEVTLQLNVSNGTAPFVPDFITTVSNGTPPYTFHWDFGNGESSTEEIPEYSYEVPGEFICTVTVTDANGENASADVQVTVIEILHLQISPPDISFSKPGERFQPQVQAYYSNGTWKMLDNITWETADSSIAYIESGSIVAGTAEGTTEVKAVYGKFTAPASVTLNFQPVGIDVTPALKFISINENYIPEVEISYSNGAVRTPDNFSLKIEENKRGDGIVAFQGNTVTAIGEGTAHVIITAQNLSVKQLVNVATPEPLNITPGAARAKPGEKLLINVHGGTTPFNVTKGEIHDNIWSLTVPPETGQQYLTISDKTGQTAVFNLTVLSPLSLNSNGSGTLKPGETLTFNPSGGLPPYFWYTSAGRLYLSDNPDSNISQTASAETEVTFKTPEKTGIFTVTVSDSSSQSAYYLVTSVLEMKVTPLKMFLSPGEEKEFRIIGGSAPHSAVAQAGYFTNISNTHYKYTAPEVIGSYKITITDNTGEFKNIDVMVSHPLMVSPRKVFLDRNEEKIFKLAGGVGTDTEIVLQAMRGEISAHPENMQFTYTAPNEKGADKIFITDVNGHQIQIEIEVTSDFFFITPSMESCLRKEQKLFRVVGGTGPDFIWTSDRGDLEGTGESSTRKKYTSPEIIGSDAVSVMDNEENNVSASVHVISDRVMITPEQVFLKPGEETVFRALLGTEEYEFSFTNGAIQPVENHPDRISYTAPAEVGEFYVTVYDTAGNRATASVIVSGGAEKPPVSKIMIHTPTSPKEWPDSTSQPVGVGNIQNGGSFLDIATNFPNYRKPDGTPIPTNYYFAIYAEPLDIWLFWGNNGAIYTAVEDLEPLMTRETDAIYQSLLSFELCNPDAGLPNGVYKIYAMAVESGFDPDSNLALTSDALFELWQFQFIFNGCTLE